MNRDKITNVVMQGIETKDYPHFCDAYIESADYNGVPMREEELDEINEDRHFVDKCINEYLF